MDLFVEKGFAATRVEEVAARAEALKEAAVNKADVAHETMVELRGLLNQAAGYLEALRRADAGSAA